MFPNIHLCYSLTGIELTKKFEGCRLSAYPDSGGVWTIGYGHTRNVKKGDTCTQLQADHWLIEDKTSSESAVRVMVIVPLTQNEFDALVDFVINIGAEAFSKSTLLAMLNHNNKIGATEQFTRWDEVKGQVIAGLFRRRVAEENEFRHGAD